MLMSDRVYSVPERRGSTSPENSRKPAARLEVDAKFSLRPSENARKRDS